MSEIQKLRAERQITDALSIQNGPRIDAIHDLPPNSLVLVWREGNSGQTGHWDGPYNLLIVDGETYTIQLLSGPTAFRSTTIKPYYHSESETDVPDVLAPVLLELESRVQPKQSRQPLQLLETPKVLQPPGNPPKRSCRRLRKYPILIAMTDITIYIQSSANSTQFSASR